jgi:hypothetical protein
VVHNKKNRARDPVLKINLAPERTSVDSWEHAALCQQLAPLSPFKPPNVPAPAAGSGVPELNADPAGHPPNAPASRAMVVKNGCGFDNSILGDTRRSG